MEKTIYIFNWIEQEILEQKIISIKYIAQILFFLIIPGILFSQGFDDTQLWHAEKFEKPINDKTSLALEQDFRIGENMTNLVYFHADFGIKRIINKTFSFNLNFREVFEQKGPELTREHRPHGQIAWKRELGPLAISSRARLEYRIRQDKDPVFRNRDMLSLKYGKGFTPLMLVPYVANEIFYDFKKSELNRNRFFIGVNIGSIKSFKPTIYFLIQTGIENKEYSHIGILGFKLKF